MGAADGTTTKHKEYLCPQSQREGDWGLIRGCDVGAKGNHEVQLMLLPLCERSGSNFFASTCPPGQGLSLGPFAIRSPRECQDDSAVAEENQQLGGQSIENTETPYAMGEYSNLRCH